MKVRKFISTILICVIALGCTACSNDSKQSKATSTAGQSQDSGRLGNENYNIANGGQVDEENGWIFYSLGDGLFKCKEDGTEKQKIYDVKGGAYDINVIGDLVYYRNDGINCIKADGTRYEQIAAEDVRGGVHFIDGKIYNGSEYRMNFNGSQKERIYNKNAACAHSLNIVDGWVYFFDTDIPKKNDYIFKMRLDGSDYQSIYDGRADYMIVDGEWIYFVDGYHGKDLCKMKTDGSEKQLITEEESIKNTIVRDGWIYYISNGINKIKIDGTEKQKICETSGDIQLHGDWIYFERDEKLYRVKTDGSDYQQFAEINESETSQNPGNGTSENIQETQNIELIHTYGTEFGETNAITYPKFTISYPKNWSVSERKVTLTNETFILTNERGVEIEYSHIGDVAEGKLGGGSSVSMSRVEVSEVAKSSFVPGYVQATDHKDLGEFVVAKLKLTGTLNMKTDSEFTNIDGDVSFAVVPKSRLGVDDSVTKAYSGEFAFWYSSYISLIAKAPEGGFTPQEEKEVIAILASFQTE